MYCEESKKYRGYSIDLLDELAKRLNFRYDILFHHDHFGHMAPDGSWDNVMKDLIEREADLGLGSMSVTAEREAVIDFSVPYFDLVGITIMMKKIELERTIFRFLTVLETNVWLYIIATYFVTRYIHFYATTWLRAIYLLSDSRSIAFSCGYLTNIAHSVIKITRRDSKMILTNDFLTSKSAFGSGKFITKSLQLSFT